MKIKPPLKPSGNWFQKNKNISYNREFDKLIEYFKVDMFLITF